MLHPRLKTAFYAVLAFLAAVSVKVGAGGVVILQFPPLASLVEHVDLYAGGLLVLIEIFGRVVPTEKDSSFLVLLARLADSIVPNRAAAGGRFNTSTYYESIGGAAV